MAGGVTGSVASTSEGKKEFQEVREDHEIDLQPHRSPENEVGEFDIKTGQL